MVDKLSVATCLWRSGVCELRWPSLRASFLILQPLYGPKVIRASNKQAKADATQSCGSQHSKDVFERYIINAFAVEVLLVFRYLRAKRAALGILSRGITAKQGR